MMTGSIHDPRYESVIVPSNGLVDWIRESTGYLGTIRVVPGSLEQEFVRSPRRFTRSRPKVLIVDRLDKHRGEPARVRDALDAQGIDVTFVSEHVPRMEFVQRFVDHDFYLHLSYREGFPISILEAFGAGCLVIGFSGRGGLEFMVDGENCFVIPDGDWQAVVDRVTALGTSDADELDKVLSCGRETALRYPESKMIEGLAQCFVGVSSRITTG
jgi:hypothetical protein